MPLKAPFSPRNLKYMRAFAAAWPDRRILQRVIAQIPWRSNIALLDKLRSPRIRLWYAVQTIKHGWSQPILSLQIESHLYERQGKAGSNFPWALPPADSDMAAQVFRYPYLFEFLGTADPRRERRSSRHSWITSSGSCWNSVRGSPSISTWYRSGPNFARTRGRLSDSSVGGCPIVSRDEGVCVEPVTARRRHPRQRPAQPDGHGEKLIPRLAADLQARNIAAIARMTALDAVKTP